MRFAQLFHHTRMNTMTNDCNMKNRRVMKLFFNLLPALLCVCSFSAAWGQRRYPASAELPQDVVWMREIYRTVDLTQGANGALYHPVEPVGQRMNLFSTLMCLLAQKKVPAYEYRLDGTEYFESDNEIGFREVLDRFQIYYEMKKTSNRGDSIISISNSDIPSADVLSYFIKEVWYFDQRTSTYASVVTALCPVLHRAEEFSYEKVKLPMFWVNYKDLAPYLAQSRVAVSNHNNAAGSSWDAFFSGRLYEGDIYKTTNLQNRTLAQYCLTDSALVKEQQRIERELKDFERVLYGADLRTETDSTAVRSSEKANTTVKRRATQRAVRATGSTRTSSARSSAKSASSSSKREATAPKASVRRQRR